MQTDEPIRVAEYIDAADGAGAWASARRPGDRSGENAISPKVQMGLLITQTVLPVAATCAAIRLNSAKKPASKQ